MSIAPRHYIERLGVSGIVVLSSEWREDSGGLQDEYFDEDIVCFREGKPRRMKVHWVRKVFRGLSYTVREDTEISEAEYKELCRQHGGIVDTAEYRERLAKHSEIVRQLEELKPLCPLCQTQMVHRLGLYGDFWGCSRYPKCRGTRSMTPSVKARIDKLGEALEKYADL